MRQFSQTYERAFRDLRIQFPMGLFTLCLSIVTQFTAFHILTYMAVTIQTGEVVPIWP